MRESIVRVDPANVRVRWASVVYRRAYSVPVRQLFLCASNNFGWLSRVRTDCGEENVRV